MALSIGCCQCTPNIQIQQYCISQNNKDKVQASIWIHNSNLYLTCQSAMEATKWLQPNIMNNGFAIHLWMQKPLMFEYTAVQRTTMSHKINTFWLRRMYTESKWRTAAPAVSPYNKCFTHCWETVHLPAFEASRFLYWSTWLNLLPLFQCLKISLLTIRMTLFASHVCTQQ